MRRHSFSGYAASFVYRLSVKFQMMLNVRRDRDKLARLWRAGNRNRLTNISI
jgi:hypothetical protein